MALRPRRARFCLAGSNRLNNLLIISAVTLYIEDEDERDDACAPLRNKQENLLPLICPTRAVSREGTVAKARMLHL